MHFLRVFTLTLAVAPLSLCPLYLSDSKTNILFLRFFKLSTHLFFMKRRLFCLFQRFFPEHLNYFLKLFRGWLFDLRLLSSNFLTFASPLWKLPINFGRSQCLYFVYQIIVNRSGHLCWWRLSRRRDLKRASVIFSERGKPCFGFRWSEHS